MARCVSKPRVFLIDDDVSVLRAVGRLVGSFGYDVTTFSSGKQGIEAISRKTPDCVIVDVQMPEINGLELMRAILASGALVPFIIITAFPKPADRAVAMSAGAAAYMEKPFNDDELFDTLSAVFEDA